MAAIAQNLQQAALLTESSDSARLDVEVLLAKALEVNRTYLYTWPEKQLAVSQQQAFEAMLDRRRQGEPIAYIIGEWEFWSLSLKVNSSTLIPRPETELLVEKVLELLPAQDAQKVVDLGTGSGAIALALGSERPAWKIWGLDYSAQALLVAQNNRQRLNISNVTMLQSDWLSALDVRDLDCIVSNPPYIDKSDAHLHQGDVRFEPSTALVAANNGLADITDIAQASRSFLKPKGLLLVEHGFAQATAVRNIFQDCGYQNICGYKDLAGLARMTLGYR